MKRRLKRLKICLTNNNLNRAGSAFNTRPIRQRRRKPKARKTKSASLIGFADRECRRITETIDSDVRRRMRINVD